MRQGYPWLDPDILSGRPNVGAMLDLCEENYACLLRLIPGLRRLRVGEQAWIEKNALLYVLVQEQTPYTTTIRLTYLFASSDSARSSPMGADPDARIRLYHDARQIEVLGLEQNALPIRAGYQAPSLLIKWRLNLFLSKWLGYCWRQGYCFDTACFGELDENCMG